MPDRRISNGADAWDSHRLDLARDGEKIKFMIVQNHTNEVLAWVNLSVSRTNGHIARLRALLDEIEDSDRIIAPDKRISQ